MFDKRNRLVHPKSKRVVDENGELAIVLPKSQLDFAEQSVNNAKQSVNDMFTFFDLFQEFDETIETEIALLNQDY